MKSLTLYTPDEKKASNVLYLKDENGSDWYESIDGKLWGEETVKIAFDAAGIIRLMDADVSKLWPLNLSVAELKASTIPAGISLNGAWVYDGKKITPRAGYAAEQASNKKQALMAAAGTQIAILQDAVDLGMATETETAALTAWKTYRVNLSRLDTSTDNIDWPVAP
ncbi:tail fiber assembly protein [Acerihabitans arboris]|uniref:Tail fiber assembly protein n=1 Tax=Acerihabitans arboris TaxID=2691583 RepID=A0A845SQI4_9GAMM|nr:tail fiber assembly protein [Acerihabitans arboris]NDL64841.1 tail fiber assembly protein [Acerihabitans arboris]